MSAAATLRVRRAPPEDTTGTWLVTFATGEPSEVSAASAGISSAGVLAFMDHDGDLIRAFAAGEWTRVERLKTAAVDPRRGRPLLGRR